MKKFKYIESKYKYLLLDILKYFNASKTCLQKERNEIKIVDFENEKINVKSFKIPNFIKKIAYTFLKDSKAKKSYNNSLRILEFVPKPLAYIEFYKFGLLDKTYFLSEHFFYDFTIRDFLCKTSTIEKNEVFKEFAKFSFALHNKGIYHLDFSPGNILIKKQNSKYCFKIVDINRMKFIKFDLKLRMKNFAKLWADDDDLRLLISYYAKLLGADENKCIQLALAFSKTHKKRINFKKKLRGKNVN